jgi:multisubunit Na+/H+ antiporter MnhB subunit
LLTDAPSVFAAEDAQRIALLNRIGSVIGGGGLSREDRQSVVRAQATDDSRRQMRLTLERATRVRDSLIIVGVAVLVLVSVALASWRAFVSTLAGCAAYYVVYNLSFFIVHGYRWSLSAFNTEEYLSTFFNMRMVETVIAGLVGVAVAAVVYPYLRRSAKGPRVRGYLGGWLALAPATTLVIMATLAVQVAWFLWAYGARIVWTLPDFKWAFKYDLDLIQMTALAGTALLGTVVSYAVGRYHPRVRTKDSQTAS